MRGSGKLRRDSHPAVLAHRAQEPSTHACDLPRFANSWCAGHRLVVRALGAYSAAGVQIVSFPELPISIRAGMTVASGLLFPVGLLSRVSFGRNGRQKPEADATAFERLFAMADQTENSPAHKAVEVRPSYCQEQQQRQAKGMRGSTAQNRQLSRAAHSPISLSHAPRSLQPDARL